MPSAYYTSVGKSVVAGNVAYADDLNQINLAVDVALEQVEADIGIIQYGAPYYSTLAQKWAENPEDVEVTVGSYSALHWAAKAHVDAAQTAADRVQTGEDAASAYTDMVDAGLYATAASNSANTAEDWAATPYNTEVAPGKYSALHYATVAQNELTPSNLLADIITVDGAASGLDADLLDGQQGSYYAPIASPTFTGTPAAPTAAWTTNSTQLATTAHVYNSFPGSLGTSGYQKFKNGLVLQWGTVVCSATPGDSVSVAFPLEFTTVYIIVATGNTANTSNAAVWYSGVTTTGFNMRAALGSQSARWLAVGYITPA